MKRITDYDVVICGAGHAGVEAAYILDHYNIKTSLVTIDASSVGRMSCNPAIGGLAKGQIVKEIDLLGGIMPQATDYSALQYKMLNKSKGKSVWSTICAHKNTVVKNKPAIKCIRKKPPIVIPMLPVKIIGRPKI